jgi:hypothetical protein
VSDHHHYGEYAEARHDHRGEYADDRHDHGLDYAERHHRHHDLEREDERLKALLGQYEADLRELREALAGALDRIRALEAAEPSGPDEDALMLATLHPDREGEFAEAAREHRLLRLVCGDYRPAGHHGPCTECGRSREAHQSAAAASGQPWDDSDGGTA